MPKLKIRVNYMMKNSMYEFVKEVAENMELSASELLRRILDEWRVDLEEGTARAAAYNFGSIRVK